MNKKQRSCDRRVGGGRKMPDMALALLKVHKHEFLFYFFCRNRNLMVPRACNMRFLKIVFDLAQGAMKLFPRMLSMDVYNVHVKTVNILPLAKQARKFVRRRLSVRWNHLLLCSVCDESFPCMLSMRMLKFSKITQKYQIKMQILTIINRNFGKPSGYQSIGPKWTFNIKKFYSSPKKFGSAYAMSPRKCSKEKNRNFFEN
jgi:hypothetical protein